MAEIAEIKQKKVNSVRSDQIDFVNRLYLCITDYAETDTENRWNLLS